MIRLYQGGTKQLFIRAEQLSDRVEINLVDENGKTVTSGHILSISDEGLFLHGSITKDAPFPLDERGQIKICDL